MAYLLGCDVGTGGAKSVIINEQGAVLGSHYMEYPLSTPRPGIAEQDPELYWLAAADCKVATSLRVSSWGAAWALAAAAFCADSEAGDQAQAAVMRAMIKPGLVSVIGVFIIG